MFKLSKWIAILTLAALMIGAVPLAGCNVGVSAAEPVSVAVTPTEAYNPILTQHTLVAVVKDKNGTPVSGALVEWILNRAPGAVGDIVSLEGGSPQKIDNTYGVAKTDSNGEASLTITSTREGDTDITVYVPAITDPANHKWFAVKHWLDITARFPSDAVNAAGTTHLLNVQTVKASDGTPVGNVPVRFTITGNTPKASFMEATPASTSYTVKTDPYGFAVATLQQTASAEGTNTVKIDVLVPADPDFVLLSANMTKKWQATKLGITKVGPDHVSLNDQATYTITVNNTGELQATGVVVTDQIPLGMTYVSSSPGGTVSGNVVTWNVGSLDKDASRSYTLVLQGTQPGLWVNTAVASSNEVGTATAQATTRVSPPPEVMIKKTGPAGVFTGFTRAYTLTVTNTGSVALTDVIVTDHLPPLLNYTSSNVASTVTGNQISWNLGSLNIGETKSIIVILGGEKTGTAVNTATVTTNEGATSTDSLTITVLGAPGAHMSLIDSSDPVAVGDEFTYTIRVLNQSEGNSLHNLTITGLLPGEVVFVGADGPVSYTVSGQEVRFNAIAELLPGQTKEFTITVKATGAGAAVFNATMNWDEFGEPIVNQEGTTIFMPQS
ncbi:MAG: DUF11 domain-containing protein [Dehalococcoidaceae bacterium]|nr:DUF11 domain-containing protein [Dehalococcoidaceae bacterium]